MSRTKLQELSEHGQSVWLDYLSRGILESGKLAGDSGPTGSCAVCVPAPTPARTWPGVITVVTKDCAHSIGAAMAIAARWRWEFMWTSP